MSEKIKVKVNTMTEKTRIKMKGENGDTVCYITYNPKMNSLGILNNEKVFVKWVPLG